MFRRLYTLVVRLHPRVFRERFADEMLWIFDQTPNTGSRGWLLADAVCSVFRQRLLRPDSESARTDLRHGGDGVPVFEVIDRSSPRAWVLLHGALLTVLSWFALSVGIDIGNQQRAAQVEFAGVHYLVASRLQAPSTEVRSSERSGTPRATYDVARPIQAPATPLKAKRSVWSKILSIFASASVPDLEANTRVSANAGSHAPPIPGGAYVRRPRSLLLPPPVNPKAYGPDAYAPDVVLSAIDSDLDRNVSAAEIAGASKALLSLDRNQDSRLTAEECWIATDPLSNGRRLSRAFATLDRDGDGELSRQEIANAGAVLMRLDRNGDRRLTTAELYRM